MIRLNQRGRDLRRVIASIAAYATIGIIGAAGIWICLAIVVNVAKDYS